MVVGWGFELLKFGGSCCNGSVVVCAYAFFNVAIDAPIFSNAVPYAFVHSSGDAVIKSVFDSYVDLLINGAFGDCGDVCVDLCDGLWHSCCKYVYVTMLSFI